jgi:hypothetical protein
LNSEIVLKTITDTSVAIKWLKSTYLYKVGGGEERGRGGGERNSWERKGEERKVAEILTALQRIGRNPSHYGIPREMLGEKLDMRLKGNLNAENIFTSRKGFFLSGL